MRVFFFSGLLYLHTMRPQHCNIREGWNTCSFQSFLCSFRTSLPASLSWPSHSLELERPEKYKISNPNLAVCFSLLFSGLSCGCTVLDELTLMCCLLILFKVLRSQVRIVFSYITMHSSKAIICHARFCCY